MKLLTPVHLPLWIFLLSLAAFVTNSNGSEVIRVSEGSDVILPCSLKQSVVQQVFDWKKREQKEVFFYDAGVHYNNGYPGQDPQFKGRVSHFPEQLQFGNASIKINNTKITDSGDYTCVFPRVNGGLRFNIKLVVCAVPKPTVVIVGATDFQVLLKCEVLGAFPKPELRWKDSDGNILDAEEAEISERDGRYDISLQASVNATRTNCFQCVVHQKDLNHETGSNITVPEKLFAKPCGKDYDEEDRSRKVTVEGFLAGMMTGVVPTIVLALLLAFKFIKIIRIRGKKKDDETMNHETKKPLSSTITV